MTFFDISRKMLKAGFYKYRLYFLCNLSATALFCCFAVISTNRTFMNASIVNSSISNNIYLPFFLSAVFLVFFLPVSCQAFLASRKQEYGVMFSLGMSRKEAFRNIPPSVVGTILSFLPSYYLNESYGMGTNGILAGIVFGVILTVGIFVVIRRYSEKEEKLYESGFIIQGRGFFERIF